MIALVLSIPDSSHTVTHTSLPYSPPPPLACVYVCVCPTSPPPLYTQTTQHTTHTHTHTDRGGGDPGGRACALRESGISSQCSDTLPVGGGTTGAAAGRRKWGSEWTLASRRKAAYSFDVRLRKRQAGKISITSAVQWEQFNPTVQLQSESQHSAELWSDLSSHVDQHPSGMSMKIKHDSEDDYMSDYEREWVGQTINPLVPKAKR